MNKIREFIIGVIYKNCGLLAKKLWIGVKYMWIQEDEIMDYEKIKKNANDIGPGSYSI